MSSSKSKKYELVLEGFENETPQSVQKVKGILIGDMELTIPEVQKILESFPLTIKRSETEIDLSVHYKSLKAAGAKVLLLKKEESQESEENSNEIEFTLENTAPEIKKSEKTEEKVEKEFPKAEDVTEEIEFELSLDDFQKAEPIKKQKEPGSYELNLDENSEDLLKDLEKEFGESLQITENQVPQTSPASTEASDFSLDLQPVTGVMELIDSPAEANTPADNGAWEPERLSESLISEAVQNVQKEVVEAKPEAPPVIPPKPAEPVSNISKIEATLLQLEGEEDPPAALEIKPSIETKSDATLIVAKSEIKLEDKKPETVPSPKTTKSEIEVPKAGLNKEASIQQPIQLPKSQSKSKKYAIPNDLLISILVGGILLGVVNWFYFSGKEAQKAAVAPKIVVPDVVEPPLVKEEKAPEAPLFEFAGEIKNEVLESQIKLSASIEKAILNSLEITTPKPADLTPEEIVNNIPARIWLKKAEAASVHLIKDDEGNFSGKASLKMYFEQGDNRDRIVGEVALKIIPTGDSLKTEITINPNEKLTAELKYELDLKKVIPLEPPIDAAPAANAAALPPVTQPSS